MAPLARVAHSLPGRKRVKIDEKRGDDAYFATLEKELAECPGVVMVTTDPRMGTALISHTTEDPDLWSYVAEHELFELGKSQATARTLTRTSIVGETKPFKNKSYAKYGNGPNMRLLIFLGMMGMGIAQAIKGNIAIPAIAAFWYAFSILPGTDIGNPERPFLETRFPDEP